MKKGFAMVLALQALLALSSVFAAPVAEFTTQPSGATVFVNGERKGAAIPTLQVMDLRPGETYRLRFTMPGYETVYQFFKMEEQNVSRIIPMTPEKGLLVVTSDPEGASIRDENGNMLGQTPRLVTSLDAKDVHTLVLSKLGYQDAQIRVNFDGRRPQIQTVPLTVDSGTVEITTVPAGASVTINGVDHGTAPAKATGVSRGRAVVAVSLAGYRPVTKTVEISAGYNPPITIELAAIAGSLSLSSVPTGARFYLEEEPFGSRKASPLGSDSVVVCEDLKPGLYRVRAEMKGYGTQSREIRIKPGESVKEEFRLESVMGALELVTNPAGATITVDGRRAGESTSSNPNATASDAFFVRNLMAGDHDVRVEKHGYATWTGHVTVNASETTQQQIRLTRVFTPDLRVYLSDETVEGVMVKDDGYTLTLEVSLGPKRPTMNRLIPHDRIIKRERIFAQ